MGKDVRHYSGFNFIEISHLSQYFVILVLLAKAKYSKFR